MAFLRLLPLLCFIGSAISVEPTILASSSMSIASATAIASNSSITLTNSTSATAGAYLFGNGIEGWAQFSYDESSGMWVTVNVWKGLTPGANYLYHVHNKPVPPDGNCSATGGHLNPLGVPPTPACDVTKPELCQEGDLAGKHGPLLGWENGTTAPEPYADWELKFWTESFSILGRSVVIHDPVTKAPWACGNITSKLDGTLDDNGNATHLPSNYQTDYTSSTLPTVESPNPFPPYYNASDLTLGKDATGKPIAIPVNPPYVFSPGKPLPTAASAEEGIGSTDSSSSSTSPVSAAGSYSVSGSVTISLPTSSLTSNASVSETSSISRGVLPSSEAEKSHLPHIMTLTFILLVLGLM